MTEKRFVYMNLLETEAISVSDDECYYFNEYGTVKKICEMLNALHKENERSKQEVREYIKALNKTLEEREELWEENEQLKEENQALKNELNGIEQLLQSYRKTIKHDAELLADATKNGYLPPLEDWRELE